MADDTSTTTVDGSETDTTGTDDTGSDNTPEENGLPDGARKALAAARKQAREAEKARKAAEAEVAQFKQRDMTDQQKLEQRATTAEKAAEDATKALNRIHAAMAAGLEFADADLITGSTPEEMKASAERLAERFGARVPDFDGGARGAATRPADMNDLIRRSRSTR
jgi:uncharacterized protein (DUF849 family)